MKPIRTLSKHGLALAITGCLLIPSWRAAGQDRAGAPGISTNAADKAACELQLNRIYGALQQYRKKHENKLPDKLSDLFPEFISDPNVLVCPFVQKRGGLRTWRKRQRELDPDAHTSYGFEFPPVALEFDQWRGLPKKSWREFKEAVVKELGPVVPIVRCHDHRPTLNLAIGGQIYESELYWEKKFRESDQFLMVSKLFAVEPPANPPTAVAFPPRDPQTDVRLIDLSDFYNASLTNAWQGFPHNHLGTLPTGLCDFGGVRFDVRGVIQLCGEDIPAQFPKRIDGIRVKQKCDRLHFLHALGFTSRMGTIGGRYFIHYADGRTEEIPLVHGKHIADWWFDATNPADPTDAKVAWTGENEAAKAYGKSIRLFRATWENPLKTVEIATVSFDCGTSYARAPFLIAITLE
jgi:hypothetical protein